MNIDETIKNDVEDFVLALKMRRLELGLSQKALGELVDVTQSNISEYEGGLTYPTLPTLFKVCLGLRVKVGLKYLAKPKPIKKV